MVETTYERRNKEDELEVRVNENHPALGKYIVRVSRLLYVKRQANSCCHWLNKMIEAREGVDSIDRFRVVNYKGSHQTWVVVRKVMANDLVESIDEFVEVKQR